MKINKLMRIHSSILLYFFIFSVTTPINSQVGNQCNLPITRKKGVCKKVNDCPSAAKQAKVGILPVICGRLNNVPIVCCEGTVPPPPVTPPPAVATEMRKSEAKCKEYTRSVVSVEYAVPLSAQSSLVRLETAKCMYNGVPLIFGGEEAGLGEFPHMALLGYRSPPVWLCGGSLISEQFVLTAAHCLSSRDFGTVTTVRLGELNIKEPEPNSEPEDFGIVKTYRHPNYTRPQVYNDIALIRLSRTVTFTSYKRPACLWSNFDLDRSTTVATGWGTTEKDPNAISDALLKVGLNIINNDMCQKMFENYFDRKLSRIEKTMICARNTTHLGDTCTGDSGGPIQVTNSANKCVLYVIGVTAVGRACGGNLPGIYTRVSEYINWIESIVWP